MLRPTFRNLARLAEDGAHIVHALGSSGPQRNPRFYKYHWQVFSGKSPWEDGDFFEKAAELSFVAYVNEVKRLSALGRACLVYGFRRPRYDPVNPWDLSNLRWRDVKFAISWDEDPDPVTVDGHK